jgi:hypothetical protein
LLVLLLLDRQMPSPLPLLLLPSGLAGLVQAKQGFMEA